MDDAEKLEAIANFLEIQSMPAQALTLRQIAGRMREADAAIVRMGAMFEPSFYDPEGRMFRSDVDA